MWCTVWTQRAIKTLREEEEKEKERVEEKEEEEEEYKVWEQVDEKKEKEEIRTQPGAVAGQVQLLTPGANGPC